MERHDILEMMTQLKLVGMRAAFDDILADGLKRQHSVQRIVGEQGRASPESGIVYDSLRHAGGVNVVCYRPRDVGDLRQTVHWELLLRPTGKIIVRKL